MKSWFTESPSGARTFTVEAELVDTAVSWKIVEAICPEIISKIAEDFLKVNKDVIVRDILDNPKFADAVYNAIVLKKASKELP